MGFASGLELEQELAAEGGKQRGSALAAAELRQICTQGLILPASLKGSSLGHCSTVDHEL